MSQLGCNVVLYRPDPAVLAAKFRYWHLETLLGQAATLIDRCLEDFREYSSLDYAWHEFQAGLEVQEKELDLYKPEAEAEFDQTDVAAQDRRAVSDESQQSLPESRAGMQQEEGDAEPSHAEPAWMSPTGGGRKSRIELRAEAFQKKKELSAPGRPFALNEQRDLTLKRLCRDYEEAVNRACVAEDGFIQIFGHAVSSPLPSEAETLGTSITTLAIWIRDLMEWLVRYQHREQAFTRVVSVRSLLNRNAWANLRHARDSFSTKLQVPADLFRGHDNCRLQGVGASLVGEAGAVPWSMLLRLPEEAVYERSGQSVWVDQSHRPHCLLGRVESNRSPRPLEICGETSFANASPVGRPVQGGMWSLELLKPIGSTSESFTHIDDVILELHAVGLPQGKPGT